MRFVLIIIVIAYNGGVDIQKVEDFQSLKECAKAATKVEAVHTAVRATCIQTSGKEE